MTGSEGSRADLARRLCARGVRKLGRLLESLICSGIVFVHPTRTESSGRVCEPHGRVTRTSWPCAALAACDAYLMLRGSWWAVVLASAGTLIYLSAVLIALLRRRSAFRSVNPS